VHEPRELGKPLGADRTENRLGAGRIRRWYELPNDLPGQQVRYDIDVTSCVRGGSASERQSGIRDLHTYMTLHLSIPIIPIIPTRRQMSRTSLPLWRRSGTRLSPVRQPDPWTSYSGLRPDRPSGLDPRVWRVAGTSISAAKKVASKSHRLHAWVSAFQRNHGRYFT
jgi:hypothetical protein